MDHRSSRSLLLLVGLLLPLWACGGSPGAEELDEPADEDSVAAAEEAAPAPAGEATGREATAESPAAEASPEPSRETQTRSQPASETRPAGETAATAPPEEEPESTVPATLAAGTEFPVTLNDSLDTRSLQAGDRFTAEVGQAVANDSRIVIPSGSVVMGRVTEVRQPRDDSVGVVVLAVDSVRVRDATVALAASVVDAEVESRSEMTDEAAKIGGGAAAGALIGAIAGKDVKSAIIGAAGGAAAGTAIAMGTKSEYGVLPPGAILRLRLEEPVTVSVPR